MSTEANAALVRRYIDAVVNAGKLELLDEFLAPEYRRYLSPTSPPLTPEAQRQRLAGIRAAFPDVHLTIEDLIAEGDRVAFRVTFRGTHRGTFQGIPPSGRQVCVFALDVVRIVNGRLSEHWGGPDLLTLLQQLGASVSAGSLAG